MVRCIKFVDLLTFFGPCILRNHVITAETARTVFGVYSITIDIIITIPWQTRSLTTTEVYHTYGYRLAKKGGGRKQKIPRENLTRTITEVWSTAKLRAREGNVMLASAESEKRQLPIERDLFRICETRADIPLTHIAVSLRRSSSKLM